MRLHRSVRLKLCLTSLHVLFTLTEVPRKRNLVHLHLLVHLGLTMVLSRAPLSACIDFDPERPIKETSEFVAEGEFSEACLIPDDVWLWHGVCSGRSLSGLGYLRELALIWQTSDGFNPFCNIVLFYLFGLYSMWLTCSVLSKCGRLSL